MEGYSAEDYRVVEIMNFSAPEYAASLLLVRRSALPRIHFLPLKPTEVARYQLPGISQQLLYASLNSEPVVR
jgi:hypothetical protein